MDVKNNDKSSKKITALEDDFSVLRIRNDLDNSYYDFLACIKIR